MPRPLSRYRKQLQHEKETNYLIGDAQTKNTDKNITVEFKHNEITPSATVITTKPLTPQQLIKVYGIDKITAPEGKLGLGVTVAVIIAYTYKKLQADLDVYCTRYGFPKSTLQIYTMNGATYNSGWAVEECLDVQMVKTFAPYANIVVVEARSASLNDILNAIAFANGLSNVSVISMSFGAREFSNEKAYLSYFNRPTICYVASSGDTTATVEFPSCLSTVLCVSGTTVSYDQSSNVVTSTWNSAGCGVSKYIAKPAYQNGVSRLTKRNCGDLSLVANPSSGVSIYCNGKWYVVGGTSVSAPLMAGFIAICNQLRIANSKKVLTTVVNKPANLQNFIYTNIYPSNSYRACFNDVIIGSDGQFSATVGYDLPTGIGSPICNTLAIKLLEA